MILTENKAKTEQKIVAAEKRQDQFLFSSKIKPGHKMWELDRETKEIREAEIVYSSHVDKKGNTHGRGKLMIKKNCQYAPALNYQNAVKRFKKNGVL